MTLKSGWLAKQLDAAERDVKEWPGWMQRAAGLHDGGKFPVRVYVKWLDQDGKDWRWRSICIVYDNESLGWLERALAGHELKIEST